MHCIFESLNYLLYGVNLLVESIARVFDCIGSYSSGSQNIILLPVFFRLQWNALNIHYTKCARIYSSLKRAFEGDSADKITNNQTTEEANLLFNER